MSQIPAINTGGNFGIDECLDFVYRLIFWKEHNISEARSISEALWSLQNIKNLVIPNVIPPHLLNALR
jgi:hypothetical protein